MFDSEDVFEEVLGKHLSRLHAFALFVACDRRVDAETLLSRAVAGAFEHYLDGLEPAHALDRAMMNEALASSEPRGTPRPDPPAFTPAAMLLIGRIDSGSLRRAAARVPAAARVAIWLVVVERRSYAEVAKLLGLDRETLCALLEWRDTMIGELLGEVGRGAPRSASVD